MCTASIPALGVARPPDRCCLTVGASPAGPDSRYQPTGGEHPCIPWIFPNIASEDTQSIRSRRAMWHHLALFLPLQKGKLRQAKNGNPKVKHSGAELNWNPRSPDSDPIGPQTHGNLCFFCVGTANIRTVCC